MEPKEKIQTDVQNGVQQPEMPTDFLTISSIQTLRLLFSICHNFKPLFKTMDKFSNFDEFVMKCAGKKFDEIIKDE